MASGYDAFVSYSHLADDALAATLQAGLEAFATPWFRPRTLRVFRDTTNLTGSPGLLTEITGALSVSRWFVLIASERAAHSRWVNEEVSWWLANRDHARFLIALSDGEIRWAGQDFDWEVTTALPLILAGAFIEEPGWVDLRQVREALAGNGAVTAGGRARRLTRHRARHQVGDWVAALAAPVRGVAKDTLVGEHLQYRRRTRRMVQAVLAAMLTLTAAASAAAAVAVDQLAQARLQNRIATSRELAALSGNLLTRHLDLAELFAVEAYRLDPSPQALSALFQAVTAGPHMVTYLPAGGQVSVVAGSADGRVIVAGRTDGTVLRWSPPNIRPTVIGRLADPVTGVAVTGSGTAVVAFSQSDALRWSAGTGLMSLRIPVGQRLAGGSISASGRFTALASTANETSNEEFKLSLYGENASLVGRTSVSDTMADSQYLSFAGDSRLVIVGSISGTWHRFTVPEFRPLGGNADMFRNEFATALSPGGDFISSSQGGIDFPVWKIKERSITPKIAPLLVPSRGARPTALAVNAAGTLAAQADDGSIYVSGVNHSNAAAPLLTLAGNSVINNGALAFAGPDELVSASGDLLTVWNLQQYSRIASDITIPAPGACTACAGPTVAVQPDGGRVAIVAGGYDTVIEQDLHSGGKPLVARSAINTYGLPLWSLDGRRLLVPTADARVQVWSADRGFVKSGKWQQLPLSLRRVLKDSSESVLPAAWMFLPGDRRVIEVASTGAILIRNATTGKVTEFIKGPHSLAGYNYTGQNNAAVDAAGRMAAVTTPHGILVTSITKRQSRTLPGDVNDKIAFYGEQLLVQQPDGPLQVWNADATRLIKVIAGLASTVAGPAVNRDGLVSEVGSDGWAVIIDLDSGVTLGTFQPPAGTYAYSIGIGMSPAGTSLVTVAEGDLRGGTGELTDWQMSAETWLKVACASAGHALTSAEWQEYVGGSVPRKLACASTAPA